MLYFELILIGISLSMDAFSLSVSLSVSNLMKYKPWIYALSVGIFHFFMPNLGNRFKSIIDRLLFIPPDYIFIIVIVFIMVGIIIDNEKKITYKILNPIIFAFIVSIDSFSLGIVLSKNSLLISSFIFSILSFSFTILGFKIGYIINAKFNKYTKLISLSLLTLVLIIKLI